MTTTRPSFSSARRPSSAIFIGGLPQPSPPSPVFSSPSTHSHLPSPPATSSGSTGDNNSTSAGSVRRANMVNTGKRSSRSDEDDPPLELDGDEDSTARYNNDIRSGKGKESDYNSSSTIQRVGSLAERNRQVIDKLTSITSHANKRDSPSSVATTSTSTSSTRSRSPVQPASGPIASSSSRASLNHIHMPPGGSGSETEREQRPSSRDKGPQALGYDATPPATGRRRVVPFPEVNGTRPRLRSAPSSPAKPLRTLTPNSPRKQLSTTFTVLGSGRRTRTLSMQQQDEEEEEEEQRDDSFPTTSTVNRKTRAPLPREFRDHSSIDGGSVGEGSTSAQNTRDRARTASPNVLVARGAASPASYGVQGTFASPLSPRGQRPSRAATVRESSRRVQRWSSVDEGSLNGQGNGSIIEEGDSSRRQRRQSGSAESPLGGGREGRSVVGEGLRAAGLTRRGTEDVFGDNIPPRQTRLSGGLGSGSSITDGSRDRDVEDLRRGIARIGIGQPANDDREPQTPPTGAGSRFGTARNLHNNLSNAPTRATTSLASYNDETAARTSPLSRSRSSFLPDPERAASRGIPQHERARSSPFGRSTPHLHTMTSSEHARLMLESLSMFEAQLARIPGSSSSAPDLSRVAHNVVQSANGLNTLLRAANANALQSQIKAEVGDAPAQVDTSEVWRQVGGEYRESLRMSDELVRTMTALLLGMSRLVREAVKERGTDSPDVSAGGGGGSGRSSLDGGDRERIMRPSRRSTETDGRRSAEMPTYRESRRSLDQSELTQRSADTASRPSTSLSTAWERERERELERDQRDRGDETATRERERSSALDRLLVRRLFTPRLRDQNSRKSPMSPETPGGEYPSPTPPPRNTSDRLGRDQRELPQRTLPPPSVPPPLPSLPSESLLSQRGSGRRRSKISSTSTATVRGPSIFPPINSSNPTTALSPQTANADVEMISSSINPTDVTSALSGLQERDGRKRSMSAVSASSVSVSANGSSGPSNTRALRSSRARMSLDEAAFDSAKSPEYLEGPQVSMNSDHRERRRTLNNALL